MNLNPPKISAVLLAGAMCVTILSACSSKEQSVSPETPDISQETQVQTFRPADVTMPRQESYEFPFMGLTAVLPESLMGRMDRKEVAMLPHEAVTEDFSAIQYAFLSWNSMTDEQRDAEVAVMGTGYDDWEKSLKRIGTLGVYQADLADQLDDLTGCGQHRELGQSADGAYRYYLSTNMKADADLTAELGQIQATLTEMAPFQQTSAFSMPRKDFTGASVGEFTTQDVNGNTYTQEMFKDYDLTLVNIFTTWCSPCVAEIPELEELRKQMADKGVNVVGVLLDVLDEKGEIQQESLEKARLLAERTGAAYPFLLPDATYMNGRLIGIEAVPETFFVDKNGNIVGGTYSGSGSLEDWTAVVEQELSSLKEGA